MRILPTSATWLDRALLALVAGGVLMTALALRRSPAPAPANRPIQVNRAGSVTSNACRSCHPGEYASWHRSYHRTMTQVADPASVLAPLAGMSLSLGSWDYRVEREGSAFYVKRRRAGASDESFAEARQIVLLTGSHNLQFLWVESGRGRMLEHFPFGWIVAEKRWAPLTDTFLCPPEFEPGAMIGDWNGGCIDCHTTQGRSRPMGDVSFDSQVTEFGIACEACHREGREHIAENHNPLRRYSLYLTGNRDRSITNPARLNGPESALVCGQCHSVWAFKDTAAESNWRQHGATFQPGQAALPERFVVEPGKPDHAAQKQALFAANPSLFDGVFWRDGQVRVVGREYNGLVASPCFKGGEFSCLSCHDMHPADVRPAALQSWAANQMKTNASTNEACYACHADMRSRLAAHTHHAPDSAGSSCYDCHMPHTSFGLLRATRSHQVSSPTVKESVTLGRPNACNLCHLDRPLAWTAEKLAAWYHQPIPALSHDDREIAAGVKWLLQGDAAQRALVAWSMGWAPAQRASGRDWLPPYLIGELTDPYAAVRFAAGKSLQTLPGYQNFAYSYVADRTAIKDVAARAFQQWTDAQRGRMHPERPALLLGVDGGLMLYDYERLLVSRDNCPVFIIE